MLQLAIAVDADSSLAPESALPTTLQPDILGDLPAILAAPPFAIPLDVQPNLDTLRWLWLAAHLYATPNGASPRAAARKRPTCPRCQHPLAELPNRALICPTRD